MRAYAGFDHPDAAVRALRAFDFGLDTCRIAEILDAPEHVVAQVVTDERETRQRRFRTGGKRVAAIRAHYLLEGLSE